MKQHKHKYIYIYQDDQDGYLLCSECNKKIKYDDRPINLLFIVKPSTHYKYHTIGRRVYKNQSSVPKNKVLIIDLNKVKSIEFHPGGMVKNTRYNLIMNNSEHHALNWRFPHSIISLLNKKMSYI
jgi:hypothetical protein